MCYMLHGSDRSYLHVCVCTCCMCVIGTFLPISMLPKIIVCVHVCYMYTSYMHFSGSKHCTCVCVHVACMWQKRFFFQPNFCSRLVDYACSVLSDGRGSALLEPQRLVTLHHIATLLETFVQNSPTLVLLMRSKFMEEFRCVVIKIIALQ